MATLVDQVAVRFPVMTPCGEAVGNHVGIRAAFPCRRYPLGRGGPGPINIPYL